MAEVASADITLGETGLAEVIKSLDRFAEGVESSMQAATAATEAATEVSKSSIVAYAALGAAIGTVFVDFIRTSSVINTLTGAFGSILGGIADLLLSSLIPLFLPLIDALLILMGVFADMPAPARAFVVAMGLIIAAVIAFQVASGPLFPILLAIAAAIVLGMLIWQHWGEIVDWFQNTILTPFMNFLAPYIAAFQAIWDVLAGFFTWLWEVAIAPVFQWWLDNVLGPLLKGVDVWIGVFTAIWKGLADFFTWLWQTAIGPAFDWFIANIITPFVGFLTDPVGAIRGAWEALVSFFSGLWDTIARGFTSFANTLAGGLEAFINAFISGINFLIDGLNAIAGLIGQQIPRIPPLHIPRLQRGAEILGAGLVYGHPREIVLPAGAGAAVGPLPAGAGGAGTTQTFEFNTTYHITGSIPVGPALEQFKRMLDEHDRQKAEEQMSKLRRRT